MTRILLAAFLLFLLGSGFQCRRDNDSASLHSVPPNILIGKLVIDGGCTDQSAVILLAGQLDSTRIMSTWTDPDNDSVYHNIFRVNAVRDMCNLSGYGISKGDTFQFRIDPNPQNSTCYTCAIANTAAMPPVVNAVMDVQKTN